MSCSIGEGSRVLSGQVGRVWCWPIESVTHEQGTRDQSCIGEQRSRHTLLLDCRLVLQHLQDDRHASREGIGVLERMHSG